MAISLPDRDVPQALAWEPPEAEPTFTAVVAAFQAQDWIAEAVESILYQTSPAIQVVVVDDGSTDATAAILRDFGDAIEVVRRRNGGCPAAFNTAFAHARGDFVALCGADDIWEPDKLERQGAALRRHPHVDVLFGGARLFGRTEGTYVRQSQDGLLDSGLLLRELYRVDVICAPSVAIRRSCFERLGGFVEGFAADDWEYWLRCLRDGATFYFDPAILVNYRRHDRNLSSDLARMHRATLDVHRWYAADVDDQAMSDAVIAIDLVRLGRDLHATAQHTRARRAMRAALALAARPRALAWLLAMSLPHPLELRAARLADWLGARPVIAQEGQPLPR